MKYRITNKVPDDVKACIDSCFSKHNVVGLIEETLYSGVIHTKPILKMKPGYKGWTPYGTARDCGDYYIIARYDRYDRLDKRTLKITKDVDDR